jgi:hypothetical protein
VSVYDVNPDGEAVGSVPFRTVSGERRFTAKPTVAGQVLGYSSITPPVPGPVSLDNTYLASRARRVWLPASLFIDGLVGTPAYQSTGANSINFDNWALDGTVDEAVNIAVQLPADWDMNPLVTPTIFWCPSDTNTGNVAWIVRITSIASGEAMNSALESTSGSLTSAASGTQYALTTKNMGLMAAGTGTVSALLRILVYRFASDASDTYNAHDALFLGLMLEYTADM